MLFPFLKARIGGANIDMTPNPFGFTNVGGALPQSAQYSNVVQITGISVPVPVSVNAGQFRVLNAAQNIVIQDWRTSGSVRNGECIQLYQPAPYAYGSTAGLTVYVGKASAPWYVTTVAKGGGSASWGPGYYEFALPYFDTFNFDIYAAGGGGGGAVGLNGNYTPAGNGSAGGAGGDSRLYMGGYFDGYAYGGGGGQGAYWTPIPGGSQGVSGGAGGHGSAYGGNNVYAGGAGGGGGGSGVHPTGGTYNPGVGGTGGTGGRTYGTLGRGQLNPGSILQIWVGSGGGPGGNAYNAWGSYAPGGGGNGAAYISWG